MNSINLQTLASGAHDAARLASRLNIPVQEISAHRFPDGELCVTAGPSALTTIIYAPLDQPNDKLLSILFAAEALRHNGAKRLVLLAPYLCYMRQDISFHEGEAISQRAIGKLLAETVDRVITIDAHLHRTTDIRTIFPNIEADNLSAMPAIAHKLRTMKLDPSTVIVGPDAESAQWVKELASLLSLRPVIAQKKRHGDRLVDITFSEPELLAQHPVIVVDDILSSGATLITCAKALQAANVSTIDVIITHALFPERLIRDFTESGIRSIRSTHSVPHPTNDIPLDEILISALNKEFT